MKYFVFFLLLFCFINILHFGIFHYAAIEGGRDDYFLFSNKAKEDIVLYIFCKENSCLSNECSNFIPSDSVIEMYSQNYFNSNCMDSISILIFNEKDVFTNNKITRQMAISERNFSKKHFDPKNKIEFMYNNHNINFSINPKKSIFEEFISMNFDYIKKINI